MSNFRRRSFSLGPELHNFKSLLLLEFVTFQFVPRFFTIPITVFKLGNIFHFLKIFYLVFLHGWIKWEHWEWLYIGLPFWREVPNLHCEDYSVTLKRFRSHLAIALRPEICSWDSLSVLTIRIHRFEFINSDYHLHDLDYPLMVHKDTYSENIKHDSFSILLQSSNEKLP